MGRLVTVLRSPMGGIFMTPEEKEALFEAIQDIDLAVDSATRTIVIAKKSLLRLAKLAEKMPVQPVPEKHETKPKEAKVEPVS